jgi:hypothetical protein
VVAEGTKNPGMVDIQIVPGNVAPMYGNAKPLDSVKVIITESGTKAGLPIVDFVFTEPDQSLRVYSTTGRVVQGIASVINGVVKKNHPEPKKRELAIKIAAATSMIAHGAATTIPPWVIDAIEYALEKRDEK